MSIKNMCVYLASVMFVVASINLSAMASAVWPYVTTVLLFMLIFSGIELIIQGTNPSPPCGLAATILALFTTMLLSSSS